MQKLRIASLTVLLMMTFCLAVPAEKQEVLCAAAKDALIKSQVDTAVSLLASIYVRHQKGEMTLEAAQKLGANLLRDLRYGKDGYFWADTKEGVNVVLYGRKDTEGRNRLNDKDANGVYYVKEFLAKGKAGGGYIEYLFTQEGQTKSVPKRSYVKAFEPFGWVIGTGYYR